MLLKKEVCAPAFLPQALVQVRDEAQTNPAQPDYSLSGPAAVPKQRLVPAQGNRNRFPLLHLHWSKHCRREMKGLFSLHLIWQAHSQDSLTQYTSNFPMHRVFLPSTPHKEQADISLTTRDVTVPAKPPHISKQKVQSNTRPRGQIRLMLLGGRSKSSQSRQQ